MSLPEEFEKKHETGPDFMGEAREPTGRLRVSGVGTGSGRTKYALRKQRSKGDESISEQLLKSIGG